MKKILTITLLILSLSVLTGCNNQAKLDQQEAEIEQEVQELNSTKGDIELNQKYEGPNQNEPLPSELFEL
jgi:outer membrane murein-binding lipoprotein Lpp